jgi:hypothetical protein
MKTSKFVLFLTGLMLIAFSGTTQAADPGTPFDANSLPSGQRAGSLLVYNVYTSSVTAPALQNTKISITNTSDSIPTNVHLFFIDGLSCSIADRYICLTPNQTAVLLASEQDPGTTGYLLAVATYNDGLPSQHNYLIGDEYVKFDTGHFASLGADAYAKNNPGIVVSADGTIASLTLDGLNLGSSYSVASRVLAVDNIGSAADGNDTLLIINRLSGNLTTTASTIGAAFGILFDDAERPHSFNFNGGCHFRIRLNDAFPKTAPRFSQVIPAGQSGWMKFWSQGEFGISGAVIVKTTTSGAGSFNEGHTLHGLRFTLGAGYGMPVFPPGCNVGGPTLQ